MSQCNKTCTQCVINDAGTFFGIGNPPRKISIGTDLERFPINGDSWINTSNGFIYVYFDGIWTLVPIASSTGSNFQFFIETGTGATGPPTSGPFAINNNDTFRLFSNGGIFLNATTGSVDLQIEPNNIFAQVTGPNSPPPDTSRPAIQFNTFTNQIYYWDPTNNLWQLVSFDQNATLFNYSSFGASTGPAPGDLVDLKFNTSNTVKKILNDKWDFTTNIITDVVIGTPSITADMFNNLYIAFQTNATGAFFKNREVLGPSGSIGMTAINTSGTNSQIRLGKMNSNGIWEWTATLAGQVAAEVANPTIRADCDGNVYLSCESSTGSQYRLVDSSGQVLGFTVPQIYSVIVAKINSQGVWQWKTFASAQTTGVKITDPKITVDNVNYIYLTAQAQTGTTLQFLDANSITNTLYTTTGSALYPHVLAAKLSNSGNWLWEVVATSPLAILSQANLITNDFNDLYWSFFVDYTGPTGVTGAFYGPLEFYNRFGELSFTGSTGARPRYVVDKVVDGYHEWEVRVDVSRTDLDRTPSLSTDSSGRVYLGFNTNGAPFYFDANNPNGIAGLVGRGNLIRIPRITTDGIWQYLELKIDGLTGTSEYDQKIVRHSSGDFIVSGVGEASGFENSRPVYDNANGNTQLIGLTGANAYHIFMGRFNVNGDWIWRTKVDVSDNIPLTQDLTANNNAQVFMASYLSSPTTVFPSFFNRDDLLTMTGASLPSQIFIARFVDESISVQNIGIIQDVTGMEPNQLVSVAFNNMADYEPGGLIPGIAQYINAGVEFGNVLNQATLTIEQNITPSGQENRFIGDSVSTNELLLSNGGNNNLKSTKARIQQSVVAGPIGATGNRGVTGPTGPIGPTGAKGDGGTIAAECFNYRFGGTAFSPTDPGTGLYLLNSTTGDNVTTIFIDNIDLNNSSSVSIIKGVLISTNNVKGFIDLTSQTDSSQTILYRILSGTGFGSDSTGFYQLTVEKFTSGTGVFFGNGGITGTDLCITRSGDRGDVGPIGRTGPEGPVGATGAAGALSALCFNFDYGGTATTGIDPGTGVFRLNQVNVGDATTIWIDNIDKNGDSIRSISNAIISAPSSPAFINITCLTNPMDVVLYNIIGATSFGTPGTGYFEFGILRMSGSTGIIFGGPSGCTSTQLCIYKSGEQGPKGEVGDKGVQGVQGQQGPGGGSKGDPGNTVRSGFSGYVRASIPNLFPRNASDSESDQDLLELFNEKMRHGDLLMTTEDGNGQPLTRIYIKQCQSVMQQVQEGLVASGNLATIFSDTRSTLYELTEIWVAFAKTQAIRTMLPQYNVLRDPDWFNKMGGNITIDIELDEDGNLIATPDNYAVFIENSLFLDREQGKTGGNKIYQITRYNNGIGSKPGMGPTVLVNNPVDKDMYIDIYSQSAEVYIFEFQNTSVLSRQWIMRSSLRSSPSVAFTTEQLAYIVNNSEVDRENTSGQFLPIFTPGFNALPQTNIAGKTLTNFVIGMYVGILCADNLLDFGGNISSTYNNTFFGFAFGLLIFFFGSGAGAGGGGGAAGGGGAGGGGGAVGPAGPPGPQGTQGQQGSKGDKGDNTGFTGPTGPTGMKGEMGSSTGATGPTGPTGPRGSLWFVQENTNVTGSPKVMDFLLNTNDCQIYSYSTTGGTAWAPTDQFLLCGEEVCVTYDPFTYTSPSMGDPLIGDLVSFVPGVTGALFQAEPRKLLRDQWEWSKRDGTNLVDYQFPRIVNDESSNIYQVHTRINGPLRQLIIKAFDINGSTRWEIGSNSTTQLSNNSLNGSNLLSTNRLGDIYLTDIHDASVTFTDMIGNTLTFSATLPTGSTNMFVIKFTTTGKIIGGFEIEVEGSSFNLGVTKPILTTDCCQNLYLAGLVNNLTSDEFIIFNDRSEYPQPRNGFDIEVNSTTNLVFLAKYDSQDTIQWNTSIISQGNTGVFSVKALAADCCGNIYITGIYGSNKVSFFDTGAINNTNLEIINTSGSTAIKDTYLAKYNSNGIGIWSTKMEIPGNNDTNSFITPDTLQTDNCGNVYLSGVYFAGSGQTAAFYDANNKITPNSNLFLDGSGGGAFVVKYNPDGIGIWTVTTRPFAVTNVSFSSRIILDGENSFYWTGDFNAITLDFFDPKLLLRSDLSQNSAGGNFTIFLAKYSRDGEGIFTTILSGNNNNVDPDVAIDIHNQAYLTGSFNSTTLFFRNPQQTSVVPLVSLPLIVPDFNVFIAKLANDIRQAGFIGVVRKVDTSTGKIIIQFDGKATIPTANFSMGATIYLDSGLTATNFLTTQDSSPINSQQNRLLGVAITNTMIRIHPGDPLRFPTKVSSCSNSAGESENNNEETKVLTLDPIGGTNIDLGNLVALGFDGAMTAHKLLSEMWQWNAAVDSLLNEANPAVVTDPVGNVFVALKGTNQATKFYNSDESFTELPADSNLNVVRMGRLSQAGYWDYFVSINLQNLVTNNNPALVSDSLGNIYIAGVGASGAAPIFTNRDGTTTLIGYTGLGGNFIYLAKMTNDGFFQWSATVDSLGDNEIFPTLTIDNEENVYLGGEGGATSTFNFINMNGSLAYTGVAPNGETQIFIGKISPNGFWNWNVAIQSNPNEFGVENVQITTDGEFIYVTGRDNILSFGDDPIEFYDKDKLIGITGPIGFNSAQLFVAKLDPEGFWDWSAKIDATGIRELSPTISADCFGNIFVGGLGGQNQTVQYINQDGTLGLTGVPGQTGIDHIFLGKISPDGNWIWSASIDTEDGDNFLSTKLIADNCGGVFVAGRLEFANSIPTFYNSNKQLQFTGPEGDFQIVLGKLDMHGNWQWNNRIDSNNESTTLNNMNVDIFGNLYLAGTITNDLSPGLQKPIYYNRDNYQALIGFTAASQQVFIGKLANEANSQKIIGIIQEIITPTTFTAQFYDMITYNPGGLVPGLNYFINGGTGANTTVSLTSEMQALNSLCLRRCVGVACDSNVIAWNLSPVATKTICVVERNQPFSFQIQVKNSTGAIIDGPFTVTNNEIVNFISDGGVSIDLSEGSVNIDINPNIIFTGVGLPDPNAFPADPSRPAFYINTLTGELFNYIPTINTWNIAVADAADLDSANGPPTLIPTSTSSLALYVDNSNGDMYYWDTLTQSWKLIVSRPNQKTLPFSTLGGTAVAPGSLVTYNTSAPSNAVHLLLCEKWVWQTRVISDITSVSKASLAVSYLGDAVYLAGSTTNGGKTRFINVAGTELANDTTGTYQASSVWVGLINSDGVWQFRARVDGVGNDTNPAIAMDFDDAVYLAGVGAAGSVPNFINGDSTIQFQGRTASNSQIFIGKINSLGQWFWNASIDGAGNEIVPAVAAACDDGIWIGGEGSSETGTFPIYYSSDNTTLSGYTGTNSQVFFGRLDKNGIWQNRATVDGNNPDFRLSLTPDYNGNVLAAGIGSDNSSSTVSFKNDDGTVFKSLLLNNFIWAGKFLKNGTWNWIVYIDSGNTFVFSPKVTSDGYGSLYLAANLVNSNTPVIYFDSADNGTTGMTPRNIFPAIVLSKFDENGILIYNTRIEGTDLQGFIASELDVDAGGRLYLTGTTNGQSNFYNTDGTTGFEYQGAETGPYAFIAELSPLGDWNKVYRIDISNTDARELPTMKTTALGDIFVATAVTGGVIPSFYNSLPISNPMLGLTGVSTTGTQIVLGKITNEARSAALLGVVTSVATDLSTVTANFSDRTTFSQVLVPGIQYYLDCQNNSLTASSNDRDGNYYRAVGVACSTGAIILDVEGPIIVPKYECCECVDVPTQPYVFDEYLTRIIPGVNVGNSVVGDNSSILAGKNNLITTNTTEAVIAGGNKVTNDISGVLAHGINFTVSTFATGAAYGDIVCNRNIYAQSVVNVSDVRLKNIVGDVPEVDLDKFMEIVPKSFTFKSDESKMKYGLIAQNVEENFGWAVENAGNEEANKFLDPMAMIALLTKVLQEEIKCRKALEERIKELENKI
jgi:hypothetical protein